MRLLDLFSGIGGFSLGLERAGFETVAFCEVSAPCRHLLNHHWPKVPCYDDIRTLTTERLAADGIAVDAICGGFPCQDISEAGRGAGIDGARSGLWREYARLIGELRPSVVFVENVSALLGRGLGRVLGDLAALGYDAWWDSIPAIAVGAPHERDRVWIIAYPRGEQYEGCCLAIRRATAAQLAEAVADDGCARLPVDQGRGSGSERTRGRASIRSSGAGLGRDQWRFEPDVVRVVHGIPRRVDRLHGLGNAVVPQIPEILGRAVLSTLSRTAA
jgi:DNA (cytosine-5)-methyltransferase 1